MTRPIVLGITGASGVIYGLRLLDTLLAADREVFMSVSGSGRLVMEQELRIKLDPQETDCSSLFEHEMPFPMEWASTSAQRSKVTMVAAGDFMSAIASGSFLTDGMAVCPCSGATLSGIVTGASQNVIHRAAEVHLKEGRKLVLVPRETPLSVIYLENLRRAAEAGAIVLPAMPGWYHGVSSLQDLVDFIVARICDQLGVSHELMRRWGSSE